MYVLPEYELIIQLVKIKCWLMRWEKERERERKKTKKAVTI